jgi:hypothetical protein
VKITTRIAHGKDLIRRHAGILLGTETKCLQLPVCPYVQVSYPFMHPASRVREDDIVFVILPVELLRCERVDQANASSNSFSEAFTLVTFGNC